MEISVCDCSCMLFVTVKALCIHYIHTSVCHSSQLIDHPQQAVPACGSFMLQLVVVEKQQCTQHLSAADDCRHILEGRRWPGESSHCRTGDTETEYKLRECAALTIATSICHSRACPTLYCRYISMEFGSAGEGCIQQHHSKQRRNERLQGRQKQVQLVFIQTMLSLLQKTEDRFL